MSGFIKAFFYTCLFLTYPLLIYWAIQQGLVWIAPTLFAGIYFYQAFAAKNLKIRISKALVSVCLLLGAFYLQSITAKIIPVLIQVILIFYFGRTLLAERGPSFIERFVRLEFPEFPPGVSEYCRQLTVIWTGFFAFNILMCIILALWSSDYWWALYNGLIIYLMMGLLFTGEYIYRHFRFPDLGIPDPKSTIRTMIVNGRRIWNDV